MTTVKHPSAERKPLVVLLDGQIVGTITRDSRSNLQFRYEETWRMAEDSYPVSLSMPLTTTEHKHTAVEAYLWGLLPDNDRTLGHYARIFNVSARNPVALLSHIGADCAGAVQLITPERLPDLEGPGGEISVEWLEEKDVARELREARETGLPGLDKKTVGRFSLAGAQPKIALFHSKGKWGTPLLRTPTTHILKPPSEDYAGFAENEHLCLDLASELGLGAAESSVAIFEDQVAIVVKRFDRHLVAGNYRRIHQEDVCQALSVLPWNKYESDGGPGISDIVNLVQETSLEPERDLDRFIDVLILNWVIAAPDAHAKNYAFLHVAGGGVRLAPFYDIASYLPYTDRRLYDVKMAMRIGKEYLARGIALADWKSMARTARLDPDYVVSRLNRVLPRIPNSIQMVAKRAIEDGLNAAVVMSLTEQIIERGKECLRTISLGALSE